MEFQRFSRGFKNVPEEFQGVSDEFYGRFKSFQRISGAFWGCFRRSKEVFHVYFNLKLNPLLSQEVGGVS